MKQQFQEGIVVSLGNVIPPEYQNLAVGKQVMYFHGTAIDLQFERGVVYHLIRFNDIWSEN
jgi:hypothetical protein